MNKKRTFFIFFVIICGMIGIFYWKQKKNTKKKVYEKKTSEKIPNDDEKHNKNTDSTKKTDFSEKKNNSKIEDKKEDLKQKNQSNKINQEKDTKDLLNKKEIYFDEEYQYPNKKNENFNQNINHSNKKVKNTLNESIESVNEAIKPLNQRKMIYKNKEPSLSLNEKSMSEEKSLSIEKYFHKETSFECERRIEFLLNNDENHLLKHEEIDEPLLYTCFIRWYLSKKKDETLKSGTRRMLNILEYHGKNNPRLFDNKIKKEMFRKEVWNEQNPFQTDYMSGRAFFTSKKQDTLKNRIIFEETVDFLKSKQFLFLYDVIGINLEYIKRTKNEDKTCLFYKKTYVGFVKGVKYEYNPSGEKNILKINVPTKACLYLKENKKVIKSQNILRLFNADLFEKNLEQIVKIDSSFINRKQFLFVQQASTVRKNIFSMSNAMSRCMFEFKSIEEEAPWLEFINGFLDNLCKALMKFQAACEMSKNIIAPLCFVYKLLISV